jgi:polyisoprenoid-binding protein YceI
MRTLLHGIALCALIVATVARGAAPAAEPDSAIDGAKSKASFSVQHVFVERVTGSLPILGGTVVRASNAIVPESVTAVLDATKIATGEPDRDASLQSPDFFDTKKFPTWTFVGTKITPQGGTAFGIDGMLTMHGVTQPEHLDVVAHGDAAHPTYHAIAHIDRHAFGMAITRLDPTIGNTVDVTLDIVLR